MAKKKETREAIAETVAVPVAGMRNVKEELVIKVVNLSHNPLPEFASEGAAAMDVRAEMTSDFMGDGSEYDEVANCIRIFSGGRALVSTGLKVSIPEGYEIQVRPRSGLAIKNGITVLNAPGTIDSDYRGTLGVILFNASNEPFEIHQGDRIAQLVLNKVEQFQWKQVETLDETKRGDGGFGHSGVK